MKSIVITDTAGKEIVKKSLSTGSKRVRQLMGDDYISVKFALYTPVLLGVGCKCTILDDAKTEGEYYLVEPYAPIYNKTTGGYEYEPQFHARYKLLANHLLRYAPQTGAQEVSFDLTAEINVHAAVIIDNIAKTGIKYNTDTAYTVSIDDTITGSKYITYSGTSILGAIQTIAEEFNCEWWFEDNVLHFGRCEYSGGSVLEIGKNVESMTQAQNANSYTTRLIAFGSERNLPTNYRPTDGTVNVDGIVQKRLMLPASTGGYYDISTQTSDEAVVEEVVIFDDIYPRTNCTVKAVTTTQIKDDSGALITIYRVALNDFAFSKDYLLPGKNLMLKFNSGALQGMEFEVAFNPDGVAEDTAEAQLYELIRNDTYGIYLPDGTLTPQAGDTCTLYNWDASKLEDLGLVSAAENELLEAVKSLAEKRKTDSSNYECTMFPLSMVDADGKPYTFSIGEKVTLKNPSVFGTEGRQSRVIGYEYPLDKPIDHPIYTVGESANYSRLQDLQTQIQAVKKTGKEYNANTGGTGIYVITERDNTTWTDRNVLSALRARLEFLSATVASTAKEVIRFLKGIKVGIGNYGIDSDGIGRFSAVHASSANITGDATAKNLTVTGKATFFELEIQKANAAGGLTIYSPGSARIDRMEEIKTAAGAVYSWKCYQLAQDAEGNYAKQMLVQGDMCLCANFNTGAGKYTGAANRWWWRRIGKVTTLPSVASDGKKYFSFIIYAGNCADGSATPQLGDTLMVLGNINDKTRQNAIVICAHKGLDTGLTSPYIAQYVGIDDYDLASHRVSWWGYDDGNNASNHFTGSFTIGADNTPIVRDLGEYISGKSYDYYDRVSYQGSLYLMTNKTAGTTSQIPGGSDWTLQVSKGEKGNPGASIDIKGNAVAHYAKASDIPLATAESGYYLTDIGSSSSHIRGITIVAAGMIVNDIDVADGDSYITKSDGHLWKATAGATKWADCGKIQGEKGEKGDPGETGKQGIPGAPGSPGSPGADAVTYKLSPIDELLYAEKATGQTDDGVTWESLHVKGNLRYNIGVIRGSLYSENVPNTSLWWRWKPVNSTEWHEVKTDTRMTVDYLYTKGDNDPATNEVSKSESVTVELIDGSTGDVADRRVVRVSMSAEAYLSIDTALGEAEIGVKDWKTNKVIINRMFASMQSTLNEHTAEIGTSVKYDPATGRITSIVKITGEQIDLNGAVSANKEFRIDTFGNVMTGVQVNAGTASYIVEDRSNLVFDKTCILQLPNDPEFIGRRLLIIASPKSNSSGAVVKADGVTAATDIDQLASISIETGEIYLNGVYSLNNGATICEDAATDEIYNGVRRFAGALLSKSNNVYMMPRQVQIRSGYIELLGVPYPVANTVRAVSAVRNGEKYCVQITRSDDGRIDDSAADNGTVSVETTTETDSPLYVEGIDNGTPWQKIENLCQWVVINAQAAEILKGIW